MGAGRGEQAKLCQTARGGQCTAAKEKSGARWSDPAGEQAAVNGGVL